MKGSISLPPVISSQYISAMQLWREVVNAYKIKENRERVNVRIRQAFAVALTNESNLTYTDIGAIMNRNHATIIHCRKSHESNMMYDAEYPEVYDLFVGKIQDMVLDKSEEVRHMLQRKSYLTFSDQTVEHYIKTIEKKFNRKIEHLIVERDFMQKRIKELESRNNILHDKYARLKNLA